MGKTAYRGTSQIVIFNKYYSDDQTKEEGVGGGKTRNSYSQKIWTCEICLYVEG